MRLSTTLLPFALASLGGSLGAQSMNIDLGTNLILWPTPSAAYGAGAGQPGFWNGVAPPYAQGLSDLTGSPTLAQVSTTGGPGSYTDPFTGLIGDDEAFMADQLVAPNLGVVVTIDFSGLENGDYEVYTYAWESGGSTTLVDVPAGSGGPQTIGGSWSGSPHVQGVTYARHDVQVLAGALTIEVSGSAFIQSGGANGIQLVRSGAAPWTNYCLATANSTGSPALMSASGSTSVAANQFQVLAGPVPAQPGLFFYGPNQVQLTFGNGFRCVSGTLGRLGVTTPVAGVMQTLVDFTSPPSASTQITAGSTWNFQAWYRDPAAGGAFFDLSDGLSVVFLP